MSNSSLFESKRPLYQTIAENLVSAIESGEIKVGELLPSEAKLCSQYGVSRHTVRQAIGTLSTLGMVDAQPGVGTTVIAQRIGSYVQNMKEISDLTDYVSETKRDIIAVENVKASSVTADLPGSADNVWSMFEAVRRVEDTDVVMAWTQVFVLPQYGEVLNSVDDNVLVYSLIEKKFGIRTSRLRQTITAIATPIEAAKHLGLEEGVPALGILREYVDANGNVYEVSWSIHPPERYQNKMEMVLSMSTGKQV